MNTSFNRRGEPVVATAADAALAFRDMDLDALVLGDLLVTRPGGKRWTGSEARP
jgi:carbamoyltransferase